MIKSPKLYFYDTGLLAWLLGIREPDQLSVNPQRGAIFENFVIGELLKEQYNRGETPSLYFWRDHVGLEIDVIIDSGLALTPIEIKAGQTITQDYFKNINKWMGLAKENAQKPFLIYGGDENQVRSTVEVLSWKNLDTLGPVKK